MLTCNCRTGATVVTFVDAVADATTEGLDGEGEGGEGATETKKKKKKKKPKQEEEKDAKRSEILKVNRGILRNAVNLSADNVSLPLLVVMKEGIKEVKNYQPKIGSAVSSMLGEATTSVEEAVTLFRGKFRGCKEGGKVAAEFKMDGVRAQIHYLPSPTGPAMVRVFSRHSDDVTHTWMGDLVPHVRDRGGDRGWVLDVEIVAWGKEGVGTFQELSTRKRTSGSLEEGSRGEHPGVKVRVFAFDCLLHGEENLMGCALRERRGRVGEVLESVGEEGFFQAMPGKDVSLGGGGEEGGKKKVKEEEAAEEGGNEDTTIASITEVFKEALAFKAEGLMLKSLSSTYISGSRTSGGWRKLKKVRSKRVARRSDEIATPCTSHQDRASEYFRTRRADDVRQYNNPHPSCQPFLRFSSLVAGLLDNGRR